VSVANGAHKRSALFQLLKRGKDGKQVVYVTFCLQNVLIVGLHDQGTVETVDLSYDAIEERVKPQAADGTFGAPITGNWDLIAFEPSTAVC
jgi:type VI protein secretion system component Hcp